MEGQKGMKHLENPRGALNDREVAIATSTPNVHDNEVFKHLA